MYCPNCGAEAPQNLRFCKRCGINLQNPSESITNPPPRLALTGIAWALSLATVAITLGGLGIVFGVVSDLSGRGNTTEGILVSMIVLGSLGIFGIVALLIRLFSRLMLQGAKTKSESSLIDTLKNRAAEQGRYQIGPPPRSIGSVTEQTTRNFDPSNVEQRER
ncbi:MAG: hypothetical protein DMF61_03070 [Blastocatellia bacterium AA13]|nr:MAG: hypothetical protein DMF61_03070 [Blastocatellia bacterium AA13]